VVSVICGNIFQEYGNALFLCVVFLKSQCGGYANILGLLAVISELLELGSEIWYRK
jgi:hypothetical protein